MSTQAQIQAIIDTYRQAVMTKDVEKVMTLYADDILSFDAIKALQFKGKEAYRAHWVACMEMCPRPAHLRIPRNRHRDRGQHRLRTLGCQLRRHQ